MRQHTINFYQGGLIILLGTMLAACQSGKVVVREGIKMPVENAAQLDYQEAEALYVRGAYNEALPIFDRVRQNYSQTPYADNALWRMSQIFLKNNQQSSAVAALKQLVDNHPNSDVIHLAYPQLARLYEQQKDNQASVAAYIAVPLSKFPLDKQNSHARLVEEKLDTLGGAKDQLNWALSNFTSSDQDLNLRTRYQQKLTQIIQEYPHTADLEEVLTREKAFPQGLVLLRLAQLYEQDGRYDLAKRHIDDFFRRFPSHAFSMEALRLRQSIEGMDMDVPGGSAALDIRLGLLLPQSGPRANYGQKITQAITLAKDNFLAKYPLSSVHLVSLDSGDNEVNIAPAFVKLSENERVLAIIGPLFKDQTAEASRLAEQYRTPIFSLSAAEGIADLGRFTFRNSITKSEQAEGLGYLCKEILKCKKMAILMPENVYGQEFSQLMVTAAGQRNIQVVAQVPYKNDMSDITDVVKKLFKIEPREARRREICSKKEAERQKDLWLAGKTKRRCYPPNELPPMVEFDTLFIPSSSGHAKQVLPTLAYYNVAGINILGPNLWNDPEILDNMSDLSLQGVMFVDGFFTDKPSPVTQDFITQYGERYGEQAGIIEAQAYDTAMLVLETAVSKNIRSKVNLMRELKNVKNYAGVTGSLTIQENGDVRRKLLPMMIDQKKIVLLH